MALRGLRGSLLGAAAASVLLLAASCGDDDDGAAPESTTSPAQTEEADIGEVDRSAHLRYAIHYGWASFGDPHRGVSEGDALWMRPIYERLLTFAQTSDGGVELVPQLATSYEAAGDGMSITFELRDDVEFHDGTPFDAEAVRANLERATDEQSTVGGSLDSIDRIEVVDEHRVTLHLTNPDPQLPWALAWGLPGLMVSPAAFDSELEVQPVGSGPYRLVSIQQDGDAIYERWDDHWDPDAALAQRLTISTVQDGNARYNGLRTGEFDAAYLLTPLDAQSKELAEEGYHWVQGLSAFSYGVMLNADLEPFDDVRVRRAVNLALDRTAITEQLLADLLPPTSQVFNAGYLGHDPDLPANAYDEEEARRLVEEAGAVGATFELIHSSVEPQSGLAQVVQQSLADIGLRAELVPYSTTESLPAWRRGGHHAMLGHITGQPEPSVTLQLSYLPGDNPPSNNPASSVSQELIDLFDEGMVLPLDSDEREQHYREISRYLFENPIHAPIAQFSSVTVCRPNVVGCGHLFDIGLKEFRHIGIAGSG